MWLASDFWNLHSKFNYTRVFVYIIGPPTKMYINEKEKMRQESRSLVQLFCAVNSKKINSTKQQ